MSKTIRTSNNLTIDATGDIILDADGADLKLQDGGTEFGRISRITSDLVIKSMGTNNDILLKGLDGSSTITALQLDMSDNGHAIFSGNVTATDVTANSLTTNVISSNGSNADISIQPSGTGDVLLSALRVNGTTIDSSDSSAVQINENTEVDGTLTVTGAATITSGSITGITDLAVADGGTGASSHTANAILLGNGSSAIASSSITISGTTLATGDSTSININEGLIVDGTASVSGDTTVGGTLGVSGVTTLTTTNIDNLTIQDANITSSSNSNINITPGGTGSVIAAGLTLKGTSISAADSSTVNINEGLTVDGTLTSRGNIFGVQTLTGSGSTEVVNLTDTVTLLVTTGGSQAFSLADGVEGQIKIISMKTDGGSGIVTPANFVNGTRITFDDVEDTVTLLYQSTGWVALARQNATFS